ncbi:DUF427 domain-containing protein [Nocardia beijingensis]|uniref:DUF427 domain-containing protein n=1 Tax=Nocardia beijingensis TaxID=95162 RepID=UPI001894E019|nr:DUF427 domain-containing protein [Nocardia beijingensis]MBF6468611.1 DUF427 domain-containing protein [Nocardia beijingensis]
MAKAMWDGEILASSSDTVLVEGNHYFPAEAVRKEFLRPSGTHTTCPWKGEASYYTLEVHGNRNEDAAWYYPDPKSAAEQIKDHVAFWRGVEVIDDEIPSAALR